MRSCCQDIPCSRLLPEIVFSSESGNPRGNVGNSLSRIRPAISQCPVVLSFPFDTSVIRPNDASGYGAGATPFIDAMFPRPSDARLGIRKPSTACAVLTSVLLPSSPYSDASGSSPMPTPSRIMRTILAVAENFCASLTNGDSTGLDKIPLHAQMEFVKSFRSVHILVRWAGQKVYS